MKTLILILTWFLFLSLAGCGSDGVNFDQGAIHFPEQEVIVHSRAELVVVAGADGHILSAAPLDGTKAVTVTNSPSSSMTISTASFLPPTISNAVLDFGHISIATLLDNDLDVCGTGSNTHCGTAGIRVYTSGVAGAGIYDAVDAFGAPLSAGLTMLAVVGLNVAGAAVMQTFTIPATKHVMHLTDFTPAPNYDFQADFTNAGSGSYTTTIVIEYFLAP